MRFEPEQSSTRDLVTLPLKRTNESFLENVSVSVSELIVSTGSTKPFVCCGVITRIHEGFVHGGMNIA